MKIKPYNECGRLHLGRCLVNGSPTGGPICTHCEKPITQGDRIKIANSFLVVHRIIAHALQYRTRLT